MLISLILASDVAFEFHPCVFWGEQGGLKEVNAVEYCQAAGCCKSFAQKNLRLLRRKPDGIAFDWYEWRQLGDHTRQRNV
jgi:hypothetical protein